jgi:two-component system sensor histidine kinase AlgZ
MLGPSGSRQGAALYLLAWLIFGVALAWLLAAATGVVLGASLLFAVPLTLVYAIAAGFSSHYLCRAHPLGATPGWRLLAVFAFAAVLMAALWTAAALAWNEAWQAIAPLLAGVGWNRSMQATVFGLGVILYGLCAVANYLAIEVGRARELETGTLQARLMAQDAELRMLRTQVDPHFLFNSLNSISALTSINPGGAREMTVQLAEFFRHTLGLEAHGRILLAAELELVRHFLAIEQVRFGERLAFEEEVASEALDCLLPPLILQPLVENAIKHGIGQRTDAGAVRLYAARAGSLLRISIENDAGDELVPRRGAGLGLANVRQRLAAAYGHGATLHSSRTDQTFRVDLVLPVQTMEA